MGKRGENNGLLERVNSRQGEKRYLPQFINFEGGDGSGKSTQATCAKEYLTGKGYDLYATREPGSTVVGERIRQYVLLARADEGVEMEPATEMLLFMASRHELVSKGILPAIREGKLVLTDRYVHSTYAYQGAGGNIRKEDIDNAASVAIQGVMPGLTIIYDIDAKAAAKRMGLILDRMEAKGKAFHNKVRQAYLAMEREDPEHIKIVDASHSQDEVWTTTKKILDEHIKAHNLEDLVRRTA